jgi:hypothetical protein
MSEASGESVASGRRWVCDTGSPFAFRQDLLRHLSAWIEYLSSTATKQSLRSSRSGEGRAAWDSVGCALGAVPIWAFHGLMDDVVNPAGRIEPVTNLQGCPSLPARDARLTTYPDADHDSWTRTYAIGPDNDIYSWMLGITHP